MSSCVVRTTNVSVRQHALQCDVIRFSYWYRGRKFQGAKVPCNFRSRERKFQGTKVPGSESTRERKFHLWYFRSRERNTWNESSIILAARSPRDTGDPGVTLGRDPAVDETVTFRPAASWPDNVDVVQPSSSREEVTVGGSQLYGQNGQTCHRKFFTAASLSRPSVGEGSG